ncbi:MAG: hypothetical protein GX987_04805 [Tissierellia bacterium]|nr:hypothetical protein [Tissierellia bacterium]
MSLLYIKEFLKAMEDVAAESYRVLKRNKYCAILIGDTRRNKHVERYIGS